MSNLTRATLLANHTLACQIAQRLVNPYSKGLVWAECVTAGLAVIPNGLLLVTVRKVTVFPSNLSLLLAHFAFVLLLFSVASLVRGVYILGTDPCAFTFTVQSCRIFDLFTQHLVIPNVYTALFTLCIERLVATLRYQKYDKCGRPYLAVVMIGFTWLLAIFAYGIDVFSLPSDVRVPVCDSVLVPQPAGAWVSVFYLVNEWIGVLICMFLYFRSRYVARRMINRALYDLSSRFLVNQNMQVNAVLVPWVVLHIVCHLPTLILIVAVSAVKGLLTVESSSYIRQILILWRLLYAVTDPLVAFRYNAHLKQHLEKGWWGKMLKKMGIKFKPSQVATLPADGSAHFSHLAKIWVMPVQR